MDINAILATPAYHASSTRGAAMGRADQVGEPAPLYLQRIRPVDGDYDAGGAYWGAAVDLWAAFDLSEETIIFVRAADIEAARRQVESQLADAGAEGFSWFDDSPLEEILAAYIQCALWSSSTDAGEPLDRQFDAGDLPQETVDVMRADCADFWAANRDAIERSGLSAAQVGHDFWLTRNRRGAGFWDRGLGADGAALTDAAHAYGEAYLFVGDDGRIYCD